MFGDKRKGWEKEDWIIIKEVQTKRKLPATITISSEVLKERIARKSLIVIGEKGSG